MSVVSPLAFFGSMGPMELVVIGVVAILVFGGRLPETMKNLGRAYAKFRQGMNDMSHPIREEMRKMTTTMTAQPPPPPVPPTPYDTDTPPPPAAPTSVEAPTAAAPPAPPPPPSGAADEPPPV